MSLFNAYETVVLDNLFGSGTPASFSLAASTTEPQENGSGITEPSGGGYARVSITNNTANFPNAPLGGPKTNGADFTFPTANGSWGTLGWWVLYDGATPVIFGTLTPSKLIESGDILRIPTGQMTITCD
jgi:hypothetical protein